MLNPNYAIPRSVFTINNGCANVRQWLRQAYSPPNGDIAFSTMLRFRSSPFEGITSPLRFRIPPFEGGGWGDVHIGVRSFVIQSEAKNLSPFPRKIPHGVRNDKGGYLRPFAKFAFGLFSQRFAALFPPLKG